MIRRRWRSIHRWIVGCGKSNCTLFHHLTPIEICTRSSGTLGEGKYLQLFSEILGRLMSRILAFLKQRCLLECRARYGGLDRVDAGIRASHTQPAAH